MGCKPRVFRCLDPQRCPGGPLAACASGRAPSITCAECEAGTRPGQGGACEPCPGGFAGLVVVVALAGFGGLGLFHDSKTKQSREEPHSTRSVQTSWCVPAGLGPVQVGTL